MNDFPFPKELDHIVDIRVITEPKDIIIGYACFLLCCYFVNTTITL